MPARSVQRPSSSKSNGRDRKPRPKKKIGPMRVELIAATKKKALSATGNDYAVFIMKFRSRQIHAISYKEHAERNFELLHKEGQRYKITGNIQSKLKSQVNHKLPLTNNKVYIFNQIEVEELSNKRVSSSGPTYCSIADVKKSLATKRTFLRPIKNVTLKRAEVYRYMGCLCTKRIYLKEINSRWLYECTNPKCENLGKPSENWKMCIMLREMELEDDTGKLGDVVCFNNDVETILGKRSTDFDCDEDAQKLVNETLINFKLSLQISFERTKDADYPSRLVASSIQVLSEEAPTILQMPQSIALLPNQTSLRTGEKIIRNDVELRRLQKELDGNFSLNEAQSKPRQTKPYELKSKPPGYVLIINNTFKNDPARRRIGSEKDVARLKKIFELLKFKVFAYTSVPSTQLSTVLRLHKKNLSDDNISCSIVIVLSHGSLNEVEMSDGKSVNIWTDIVGKFSKDVFPLFCHRPKLFIFGNCQASAKEVNNVDNPIPELENTLVAFPTIPGFYSHTDENVGSPFILVLVSVLKDHACSWDHRELFDEVQARLAKLKLGSLSVTSNNGKVVEQPISELPYTLSFLFGKFRFVPQKPQA